MKLKSIILVILALSVILVSFSQIEVKAESKTIVVPDHYPTITDAIGNASEGDTIFVKKGTYDGPINQTLVINKTISFVGEDTETTILNLHPFSYRYLYFNIYMWSTNNSIEIDADNVMLSGFTINPDGGQIYAHGNGIQITCIIGGTLSANCTYTTIAENIMNRITITGSNNSVIKNSANKIHCSGSYNLVTSNKLSSSGDRIKVSGSHNVIYQNNVTSEGGNIAVLEISGCENIIAKNIVNTHLSVGGSFNVVIGNIISDCLSLALNNNTFEANYLRGISRFGTTKNDASNNTFYHNNFDFVESVNRPTGEKIFEVQTGVKGPEFMDNGEEGNYWSDYNGTDNDGDGIGDTPYVIHANDTRNYEYTPHNSIGNIVLTDYYPLMEPFNISSVEIDLPEWVYERISTDYIPEFPSWTILPVFLIVTTVVLLFRKKKRLNNLLEWR